MDLITTHMNADFDALGSLVAAKKFYPDSRLLLPGSQEEPVRELLSLAKDLVAVETEKDCRLDDIDRLIIVDTRHKHRIGIAGGLVDKGVEVHIYDHHPRMKGDIVADQDTYEEVGATVTILSELIKKKRLKLSHLEATIMLIGIYEETNSLTYRSTTRQDVDAVSFLLSRGANLSMASSYINRELGKGELSLLTRLIHSTERLEIKGVSVSMIELDRSDYVSDMGVIIQKLIDIENIPVLFVLINSPKKRVDIIARSKVLAVDVNKVLSRFGGGGHPGAASAKIKGEDISLVKLRLIDSIKSYIRVKICAKDIMSKSVKTLRPNTRIYEAKRVMLDEKVSAMPVTEKGNVVGVMSMEGVNKAIKRSFGHSRIRGYMTRQPVTAKPDTPMHVIQKIVIENDVGVIPVVSSRRIVGAISRTQVLKNVHEGLFAKPGAAHKSIMMNMAKKMASVLPGDIVALLKRMGKVSNEANYSAFVVGGLVRDLLLGVKNLDLDVVVEGDAIRLGHVLSRELDASLVVHRKFGTCSVVTKDKLKIDLATARKEIYEKPAALPTVEFSSLKNDLVRRDFTINAMAISLNKSSFGQLIDFFGGVGDLGHGRIRVMHDGSFIDDPTRIFRAVRFEQRFGFLIDGHTEGLIKHAIRKEMFDKVEPQRIRDEVVLILKEDDPLKALKRMAELDELRFLHPGIKLSPKLIGLYSSIDAVCHWYEEERFKKRDIEKWLVYLMALFDDLGYNTVLNICGRYVFRKSESLRILSYKRHEEGAIKILSSSASVSPSRVYRVLEPLSYEVILLIMSKMKAGIPDNARSSAISRITEFFEKYNGLKIRVRGDDLKSMGLNPGPGYKKIFDRILREKLDGRVRTRADELALARKLAGVCRP